MSAYSYRDEAGFSKFLVVLIVLSALLNSVAVGSSVMLYDMLVAVQKGAEVTDEVANAHDARQLVIGLVQLAAAIFIGIIFLMWVYRMCRNAHSIENAKLDITPGWAVGWYFVPVANLWKPYQAMKETYEAFINRENDSMILPLWWFAWIVASIMARVSTRFATETDTLDQIMTGVQVTIITDVIAVFLDVVAILMVVTVSRACNERFAVDHFEAATEDWE